MSGEEVYQKLKNDPEFLHKLAEILKPEVALIVLEEFKKLSDELKKVNENLTTLNNRVGSIENLQKEAIKELKEIRNQQEETNKRLESMDNRLESIDKNQKKMVKQLSDISNAINNLAESVEYKARRFLANKLKNEYNVNVLVRSFEIENAIQFDIFADLGDKVFLGEVKVRAGVKAIKQLERAIEKLLEVRPEFQKKKIIPMIYARRATEDLIEECNKKGIYLAIEDADLTPLKLE